MNQSYCAGGYYPTEHCDVYYGGLYYLKGSTNEKVEIDVYIDGKVADSWSATAPWGSKQYGWTMHYTVPDGSHHVVFQAYLKDAAGNVIAKTKAVDTGGPQFTNPPLPSQTP